MFKDRGYSLIKKFEEGGFQDGTRPLDLRTMKYSNGGVLTPEQRKNREGLVIKADTAGLIITNMGNFTPQQFNARFGPRYILKNDAQQESNLSFQDAMNFSKNIDFSKLNFTKANQDIKKNRMNKSLFITFDEIVEKLVISKLKCYYCKCNMLICYQEKREGKQWTLDRIDNSIGHFTDNVVCSCLDCNLKRRRTIKDNFLFSKQLKLVKKSKKTLI